MKVGRWDSLCVAIIIHTDIFVNPYIVMTTTKDRNCGAERVGQ